MMLNLFIPLIAGITMLQTLSPRDPATMALGGAGAAQAASTAFATFNNPSAIVLGTQTMDFAVAYEMWKPNSEGGSNNINAGFSFRMSEKFGFAAAMAADLFGKYEITDVTGFSRNSFAPSNLMLAASLNYRPVEFLSAAVTARYLVSNIYDNITYSVPTFDAALSFVSKKIFVSAGAFNLGGKVEGQYELPSYAFLAASGTIGAGEFAVRPMVEFDCFPGGGIRSGAGMEFSYKDMLFARAGASGGKDSPCADYGSYGIGIKLRWVHLDFVYLGGKSALAGTMCLSLGFKF